MVQPVGTVGKVEASKDGVVDLLCRPAADMTSAVQEDFKETDDAGVVDLDPRIADRADSDRQGQALE